MPAPQKPKRPKITGPRIRDPQEVAARITFAREWHLRMKPYFDALYGPRTCTGPACCAARSDLMGGEVA